MGSNHGPAAWFLEVYVVCLCIRVVAMTPGLPMLEKIFVACGAGHFPVFLERVMAGCNHNKVGSVAI